MRSLRSISLLAAAALLLAPAAAGATVLMFMSTAELVRQSTLVVEGTVLYQEAVELDHIYTDTYLLVSGEVHKGEAVPGQILVVRQLGGVTSGLTLQVAGMARFRPGEQALIFASPARGPRSEGRLMVMGAALGKYSLFTDEHGVRRGRRDLSSATVANFSPRGQFEVGGATAALNKERPTLAALRAEIARSLAGGDELEPAAKGGAR